MKMFVLGALFASSILFAVQAQQPMQTQRIPLLENDDVKVWKSVIFPRAPLAMHRHEHPRVILANRQSLLAPRKPAQHDARRCQRR
jgi:hypothetical protein